MNLSPFQVFQSELLDIAFTAAVVVGGVLLLGALVSFAVYAYRVTRGDGPRDPAEVVPEKVEDDGLTEGEDDDEWDYY